jgi:hypothetical protein
MQVNMGGLMTSIMEVKIEFRAVGGKPHKTT